MINYIYCNFLKKKNTTSTMHLFEHCYYAKLLKEINQKLPNEGIMFDASTSPSSVLIEIYFSNEKYEKTILNIIEEIKFTSNDYDEILKETNKILHEISTMDLSEEDKILYKSLELISNESIYSLYNSDGFDYLKDNIIDSFNKIIESISILLYICGNCTKKGIALSKELNDFDKTAFDIYENHIIGAVRREMDNIYNIVLSMFVSFLYAKTENSIIQEQLIKKFGLYLAYSLDIPLYNDYCIMFLIETNEKNLERYKRDGFKFSNFTFEFFEKHKKAFATSMLLLDPQLREFNKFYVHASFVHNDIITIDLLMNYIEKIEYSDVKDITERRYLYA